VFVDFGAQSREHGQLDERWAASRSDLFSAAEGEPAGEATVILLCPRCGTPLRALYLGEWFETNPQCQDCGVALGQVRPMLRPSPDDVEYALGDWAANDRAQVTDVLAEAGIPYRWNAERALILVVPAAAEGTVDRLLDGFGEEGAVADDADEDETYDDETGDGEIDDDDSERAQAAMAELFVAADRLHHDPRNEFLVEEVAVASEAVASWPAPYGIERGVWRRIQELAAALLSTSEESGDEDAVAAEAQALRDFLASYV
jgi:hypothetical protein